MEYNGRKHNPGGQMCILHQCEDEIVELRVENTQLLADNERLRGELASLRTYVRDIQPADQPICDECEMPISASGMCPCIYSAFSVAIPPVLAARQAAEDAGAKPEGQGETSGA